MNCNELAATFNGIGFVANPYDPYVFNLLNKKTGKFIGTVAVHVMTCW